MQECHVSKVPHKFLLTVGILLVLVLTSCLPESTMNIQYSGVRHEKFSDNAYLVLCKETGTSITSKILSSSPSHRVEIVLPHNTSVGSHKLAAEFDPATNYSITLSLPSTDPSEFRNISYGENDLSRGTITIARFERDSSGAIAGSFEAQFNDGLRMKGDFEISIQYPGNADIDFSCFSNTLAHLDLLLDPIVLDILCVHQIG